MLVFDPFGGGFANQQVFWWRRKWLTIASLPSGHRHADGTGINDVAQDRTATSVIAIISSHHIAGRIGDQHHPHQ
jgi:hypothetical protein